jgi:osmotically-inducible protein OsmY
MNRRNNGMMMLALVVVAMVMTTACSMNRQTPASFDKTAMEGDIRAAIAEAVPSKTFALSVDVQDGGHVMLSGHVDTQTDKDAIVAKVRQVNGVRTVDASGIHMG